MVDNKTSEDRLFDGTNSWTTHASIDRIKFDEYGAADVWRLMVKLGARPETTQLHLDQNGKLTVRTKFFFAGTDLKRTQDGREELVTLIRPCPPYATFVPYFSTRSGVGGHSI